VVVLCHAYQILLHNQLKKLLQVGILTFYRASVSSPFNRSPWLVGSDYSTGLSATWSK
jgi:hypothetical protein